MPLTKANGGRLDGNLTSLVPDGDGGSTDVGQQGGDEDTGNTGHGEAGMDELGLAVVGESLGVLAQAEGVEPEVADEGAVEVGRGRGAGAPGLAGGSGAHDDLGAGGLGDNHTKQRQIRPSVLMCVECKVQHETVQLQPRDRQKSAEQAAFYESSHGTERLVSSLSMHALIPNG